jgi:hypothetical protein
MTTPQQEITRIVYTTYFFIYFYLFTHFREPAVYCFIDNFGNASMTSNLFLSDILRLVQRSVEDNTHFHPSFQFFPNECFALINVKSS